MIVIVGATATGKSELAIRVAERVCGEIVSADSMQIYKGMDIGTAKPSREERERVPHHMTDIVEPGEPYSVGKYAREADRAIRDIERRGRAVILVGGCGLYANAVLYGYKPFACDKSLRERLFAEFSEKGPAHMHEKLASADPGAAARICANDVKRVIRALEVKISTGKSLVDQPEKKPAHSALIYILTGGTRAVLYAGINERVDRMFDAGLKDEVRKLVFERGLGFGAQCMQGIGYKEFRGYFAGEIGLSEVREEIKRHTRNYAKRQLTWFRSIKDGIWLNSRDLDENTARIIEDYNKFLAKKEQNGA